MDVKRMKRIAQSMETKWRLNENDAFTSDVVETAPADDPTTNVPGQPQPYNPNQLPLFPNAAVRCSAPGCLTELPITQIITDDETDEPYCQMHAKPCTHCRMIHYVGDMTNVDGSPYCPECIGSLFRTCPNCSTVVASDEILPPTRRNTYSMKKGGCTECCTKCNSCDRVVDKDSAYHHDNDYYCEDCYSEAFRHCDKCGNDVDSNDTVWLEDKEEEVCHSCFNEYYTTCHDCKKTVEKSDTHELHGNDYCEECYDRNGPGHYKLLTNNFEGFSYTKKDRYLDRLTKLLPISVKDLKSKYPLVANGLQELIAFAKGQTLTTEVVAAYRQTLNPEEFPVEYTAWSGLQRSIETLKGRERPPEADNPQLVVNVLASKQMLTKLQAKPELYDLFGKVNALSDKSGHPYKQDQIGWVRLDLDQPNKQVLVDEVQSDHSNALHRLKDPTGDHEAEKIRTALKGKYGLDDVELNKMLNEYSSIIKDFPNIASQAVANFAKSNGFGRIFWHTYESGKALRKNAPPKSLYETVPKENFFLPSQNRPFGLPGDFFEREAKRIQRMKKLAALFNLKYSPVLGGA
jgi:hypothetical protein